MKEGLDTLRILFYANLLNGQREAPEVIETERKNNEKQESELVKHRSRYYDDSSDNEEAGQNEPKSSSNENTSEKSTSSTTAKTTATTDIESPYENSLQIKLGLKLNEYRHGQYPFDHFVNDYVNENIEIRKEYLDFVQQWNASIKFSFIFYPFFLSTVNKIGNFDINFIFINSNFCLALLNIENKARMYLQRRSIFVHNIFSSVRINPYFKIHVRRNHLIEDALISVC